MNLSCQEFVSLLYEFVEGELIAEQHESIQVHIQACTSCGVYVESYRYTKSVARYLPRCNPLSEAFAARLQTILDEYLRDEQPR